MSHKERLATGGAAGQASDGPRGYEVAWVPEEMYSAVTPMLAVSGGDGVDDEHAGGQARVLLGGVVTGREAVDACERAATECPRIPKEFLEEERGRMGELAFRQEYMCEFGDNEMLVFSEDSILGALDWDIERLKVPPFEPRKRR